MADKAEEFAQDNCPFTASDEDSDPPHEFGVDVAIEILDRYKQSLRAEIERTRNLSERNKVTVTRLLDEVKPIN